MRLSAFIREHKDAILQEWDAFARTLEPAALNMDDTALRNHASQMLDDIAIDLDTAQTASEQLRKSQGLAPPLATETFAESHASQRQHAGFTIVQLVSEYRALRASVLKLWSQQSTAAQEAGAGEVTRFNEAIDQAFAESVTRFNQDVEQAKETFLAILGHDLRTPLGAIRSS